MSDAPEIWLHWAVLTWDVAHGRPFIYLRFTISDCKCSYYPLDYRATHVMDKDWRLLAGHETCKLEAILHRVCDYLISSIGCYTDMLISDGNNEQPAICTDLYLGQVSRCASKSLAFRTDRICFGWQVDMKRSSWSRLSVFARQALESQKQSQRKASTALWGSEVICLNHTECFERDSLAPFSLK